MGNKLAEILVVSSAGECGLKVRAVCTYLVIRLWRTSRYVVAFQKKLFFAPVTIASNQENIVCSLGVI